MTVTINSVKRGVIFAATFRIGQGRLGAVRSALDIGRGPRRLSAAVWTDDRDALAPVEFGR